MARQDAAAPTVDVAGAGAAAVVDSTATTANIEEVSAVFNYLHSSPERLKPRGAGSHSIGRLSCSHSAFCTLLSSLSRSRSRTFFLRLLPLSPSSSHTHSLSRSLSLSPPAILPRTSPPVPCTHTHTHTHTHLPADVAPQNPVLLKSAVMHYKLGIKKELEFVKNIMDEIQAIKDEEKAEVAMEVRLLRLDSEIAGHILRAMMLAARRAVRGILALLWGGLSDDVIYRSSGAPCGLDDRSSRGRSSGQSRRRSGRR